ncbi:MAG: YIP1 family protein [Candidatus Heimdallarchaeota archaeon]
MSSEGTIVRCPICNETSPQGYLLCPYCGADLTAVYQEKLFPPVTYKETFFRIKRLITQPRMIAQDIADNPDNKASFLFSVAIAFAFSLQIVAYLIHTHSLNWKVYPGVFLLSWILTLLLPILVWLIGSWIIRTITRLLGGKATGKQIRAAVGYAFLPVTAAELLIALLFLIGLPWRTIDAVDIGIIVSQFLEMRNSFMGIFGMIIHFLGFLAAGFYMVLIVKPASNFSWIEAAISVGIPLLVFLILMITYYVGTSTIEVTPPP